MDDDQKRGDDAADHAPKPDQTGTSPGASKQDAPNYRDRTDKGQALEVEDVSSANDEGAG